MVYMMKRLFIFVFGTLFPFVSNAQYTAAQLEINSSDGVYALGDSIKVWADVTPECQAVQEFIVQEDMLRDVIKKEFRLPVGRHLVYADVCTKPVNYVFTFGESGADRDYRKSSIVGAIVCPDAMVPGYDKPKDLKKFWKRQVKQMRKMPLEYKLTPVPEDQIDNKDVSCFDLEISMPEGAPVRGYIAYPKNVEPKSLPIVIIAHAAGVKGSWCKSDIKTVVAAATRYNGAIALDINAHGMLNGQPQEYYEQLEKNELKDYSSRELMGHDDFYFRLMYLRMVRALDYAVSLPQWDRKRVLGYGESQGGAQIAALAGIDKRVTAINLRVPAFMDVAGLLLERRGSWPVKYSSDPQIYEDVLPYYDGAILLSLSKAKMFIEAGLVDYTCPPSCVAAGFNNARTRDKSIVFFPYRPHHEHKMPENCYNRWKHENRSVREQFIKEYLE